MPDGCEGGTGWPAVAARKESSRTGPHWPHRLSRATWQHTKTCEGEGVVGEERVENGEEGGRRMDLRNFVERIALHSLIRYRRTRHARNKPLNTGCRISRSTVCTGSCEVAQFGRKEQNIAIFPIQALADRDFQLSFV